MTVAEERGGVENLKGAKLAYLGDAANNMAQSYLLGCALAGMRVAVAGPASHQPDPDVVAKARELAAAAGGDVLVTEDAAQAAQGADVIATDTWVSMGQEAEAAERRTPFVPYRVTEAMMSDLAAPGAIFLHCLPAYRGNEVTAGVIDGPASRVWDEAENRKHAQKALLAWLISQAEGQRA
jgi:ornithine carbamoyltransferase